MGCNCNKAKAGTLSPDQVAQKKANEAAAAKRAAQAAATAAATRSGTGATQQFALKLSSGQTLTYGSRLEAEAENVRRGYAGRVQPL